MRVSIKIVRELDGNAIHERVVDASDDGHIGAFVDEVFEKIWPDLREDGPGKYKMIVEKAAQPL